MRELSGSGSDWAALLERAAAQLRRSVTAETLEATIDLLGQFSAAVRNGTADAGAAKGGPRVKAAFEALCKEIRYAEAVARHRHLAEAEWASAFWAAVGIEPATSYSPTGEALGVGDLRQAAWEG